MLFGPDYLDHLRAVQDAAVAEDALRLAVPLSGRWPEPRVLWQTRWWWMPDRTRLDVQALAPVDAAWLLGYLRELAPLLHMAAVRDERLTTSSGLRRAMAAVGVLMVEDVDPGVWLDSTALARHLGRLGDRGG